MADPILVSTAEELRTAYNTTAKDKSTTIKVIDNIDFNSGPYSDWESDFLIAPKASTSTTYTTTLDGSWEDGQGNTQNRTISNIFLYPTMSLFLSTNTPSNALICKNLTFEVVSNGGYICYTYRKHTFENCIFNIRLYSHKYTQFYGKMDTRINGFLSFKNCVFNFYISSCIENDIPLFKTVIDSSAASASYPVIIKSCIFKIRNATDKFITLVENSGSYLQAKIYNSAIFYNDVGTAQPPYSTAKDGNYYMKNCHHIMFPNSFSKDNKIMNTYISSFDYYPLPTGFVKPIIVAFNYNSGNSVTIPDNISTSFYDGSKIDVYMNNKYNNNQPVDNYTGCLTKLTTEQCKDPAKLSEIGYMFSEET